jgi:hypothetical protein
MPEPQTFATHRRFHPLFHFFTFPLAMVYLVWTLWNLWKGASFVNLMVAVGALALTLGTFLARFYGLRVQDRLIRLEETLRMQRVLPAELAARIHELRPGQFVGLRFASDGELASLVEAALKEGIGGEQIKKRIKSWRPDTFRV